MTYNITRKINGKEYYLENIHSENKVVWVSDRERAMQFDHQDKLTVFMRREFPGKDYYVTQYITDDDWGMIVKPTGVY